MNVAPTHNHQMTSNIGTCNKHHEHLGIQMVNGAKAAAYRDAKRASLGRMMLRTLEKSKHCLLQHDADSPAPLLPKACEE